MGRVTLQPAAHIDPFGTILLPLVLFCSRAGFLFGYAKPVPVSFGRLQPSAHRHGLGRARRAGDEHPAGDRLGAAVLRRCPTCRDVGHDVAARRSAQLDPVQRRARASSTCCRCRRSMAAGSRSDCCRTLLAFPLARLERYGMLHPDRTAVRRADDRPAPAHGSRTSLATSSACRRIGCCAPSCG